MTESPIVARRVEDLVALVPLVAGFHARESLVVYPVRSTMPMARLDLPRTPADRAAVADTLAATYGRLDPNIAVTLLAYTSDHAAGDLACVTAKEALPQRVLAEVVINGDRWTRLDQINEGTISQATKDRFAAEFVARGIRAPYASWQEHLDSFACRSDRLAPLLAAAVQHAEQKGTDPPWRATEVEWLATTIADTVENHRPVSDPDAARMVADMHQIPLRDAILQAIATADSAAHAALWKDVATRTPDPYVTPVATAAAFAYWRGGNGLNARAALERVPDTDGYPLARLVSTSLRMGLDGRHYDDPAEPAAHARPDTADKAHGLSPRPDPPTMHPDHPGPAPSP